MEKASAITPRIIAGSFFGFSALAIGHFLLNLNHLYFVHSLIPNLIGTLCCCSAIALFIYLAVTKTRRLLLKICCWLLVIGLCFLFCMYHLLGTLFEAEYRIESSPSGNNRLIIFRDGWIDAVYSAYPLKNHFLYQEQDNGFISYHDFWGDIQDPEIEWISDAEARIFVCVDFFPEEGSSEELFVRFDP